LRRRRGRAQRNCSIRATHQYAHLR
jgi:hypothetical protein